MSVHQSRWGRGHPEEYTEAIALGEEKFDPEADKKPRAGQILWIRGLTRLQTQLRVIRAFKSTLEDLEERRSIHSLRSTRSRPLSDITFIDEEPGKAPCFNTNSTFTATFGPPILKTPTCDDPHRPHYCEGHSTPYLFYTLPKIPYETSI